LFGAGGARAGAPRGLQRDEGACLTRPAARSPQARRDAEAKARAEEARRNKDDDDDDGPPSGGARGFAASLGAAALAFAGKREPAAAGAAARAEAAPSRAPGAWARARESPGLALLAAGSIVWQLLGPISGAFLKVAQHPAASSASRVRM
jgi:hypothetical protein